MQSSWNKQELLDSLKMSWMSWPKNYNTTLEQKKPKTNRNSSQRSPPSKGSARLRKARSLWRKIPVCFAILQHGAFLYSTVILQHLRSQLKSSHISYQSPVLPSPRRKPTSANLSLVGLSFL